MGKIQRRAKGGGGGGRKQQRRHAVMPKLNHAQQKFKCKQSQQQQTVDEPKQQQHRRTTTGVVGDDNNTSTNSAFVDDNFDMDGDNNKRSSNQSENAVTNDGGTAIGVRSSKAKSNGGVGHKSGSNDGGVYLSAYKRAQLTYERLQAEKRAQRERAREERERVNAERMLNTRWKRKKNQALQLRTAKGQPNLNAQIGILLQQIERHGACGGGGRDGRRK